MFEPAAGSHPLEIGPLDDRQALQKPRRQLWPNPTAPGDVIDLDQHRQRVGMPVCRRMARATRSDVSRPRS